MRVRRVAFCLRYYSVALSTCRVGYGRTNVPPRGGGEGMGHELAGVAGSSSPPPVRSKAVSRARCTCLTAAAAAAVVGPLFPS